ncbi:MAG: redoxin domain-containing protein [Bacteroidales bacterium]|nr:redoxin domain-containing protein [Bacteroidales bacterium]
MKKIKMLVVLVALFAIVGLRAENRMEVSMILVPGVKAPELKLQSENDSFELSNFRGKYVLLQFWADTNEGSFRNFANMQNIVKHSKNEKLEMVSVSFEPLKAVYNDMVKIFDLKSSNSILVENGVYSEIYKRYRLYNGGLNNYLLDQDGVIIARDLTPQDLVMYINQIK